MKYAIVITLTFLVVPGLLPRAAFGQAQTSMTPEDTARKFYELYLHSLNAQEEPLKKQRAELSKLVTQRLIRSYDRASKREEGINADFFLDAQDWDAAWEKNISVSKAVIQGGVATVTVTLTGAKTEGNKTWDNKLKVGLIKEGGAWKINTVNRHLNVT